MANTSESLDLETVNVWINQAAGFAKRDNFYEAAGRMRFATEQVGAALAASAPAARGPWEALLGKLQQLHELYAQQHMAWNSKIAAGRQGRTDAAAEEMARPLPIPVDK